MCAWRTGQPVFGNPPTSRYVRENFAYIKPLIDLLSGSAVSQADLTKLHAVAASSAQIDRNVSLPAIGSLGSNLDTAGVYTYNIGFEPSVVFFFATVSGSWATLYGQQCIGVDDGTTHMCIYQYDSVIHETICNMNATRSVYVFCGGGSQISFGQISAKSATGFSLTVGRTGVLPGVVGFYLALP